MKRAVFVGSLLSAILIGIALPASAATISGSYSGFITQVDPQLSGQFSKYDPFEFNFSYEGTGTDIEPHDPSYSAYLDLTQTASVSVGSYVATGNGGDLRVYDNAPYDLFFLNFLSPTAPQVNGYTLYSTTYLGIGVSSLLPSDAVPDHYIPASAFYQNQFALIFSKQLPAAEGSGFYTVYARVYGSNVIAPIPAALPLLMTALAGLGFAAWHRCRSDAESANCRA